MNGMRRSNACFAFGCFRAGAAPTVELAFLRFARLDRRTPALETSAAAVGGTTKALDFSVRGRHCYLHCFLFRLNVGC